MISLDYDRVHQLAPVASLIEPLRLAFRTVASTPERGHYELDEMNGSRTLLLMSSWRPRGTIGVKVSTVFSKNPNEGLPSVSGVYLLFEWQTGQPLAVIDGRAITLLRTAAVSALAADLLLESDPSVLLMVGTGALSRYLIEGHLAVKDYKAVLIWGRDPAKAALVAEQLAARGFSITVAADLEIAVRNADVISCATMAEQPLIKGAWLKPNAHLDLVGSFKPAMRETDDACMIGSSIVVDTLSALTESGDLAGPIRRGIVIKDRVRTMHDIVNAQPRSSRSARTVFKSVGVALADLEVADQVFTRNQLEIESEVADNRSA
jgi:ornithine cyclodeaminase